MPSGDTGRFRPAHARKGTIVLAIVLVAGCFFVLLFRPAAATAGPGLPGVAIERPEISGPPPSDEGSAIPLEAAQEDRVDQALGLDDDWLPWTVVAFGAGLWAGSLTLGATVRAGPAGRVGSMVLAGSTLGMLITLASLLWAIFAGWT